MPSNTPLPPDAETTEHDNVPAEAAVPPPGADGQAATDDQAADDELTQLLSASLGDELNVAADDEPLAAPPVTDAAAEAELEAFLAAAPDDPETAATATPPAPDDLAAEIEALLAEQPIDPALIQAAETLATQDAEHRQAQQETAEAQRAAEDTEALDLALAGEPAPPPTPEPAPALAVEDEGLVDEDDDAALVLEIDNLLAAELEEAPETIPDTPAPEPEPEPTIDQIDQMLAAEADEEDDLAGEFFSSDAIAADAVLGEGETYDPHSPSGSPLDATPAQPLPADAPEATDASASARGLAGRLDWRKILAALDRAALQVCWLLNWPARRFLNTEGRATLGYVALLQVLGATTVWLLLVVL